MTDAAIDVLRWIFFAIDSIVYQAIEQIYNLFIMLSQTTFFSTQNLESFAGRIYVLISIIMAFRLAFSFISYIVNPDQITDKQKGGGKLITSIVIAIALLASVPLVFSEAYYLQGIIVKQSIIQKIVLDNNEQISNEDATKVLSAYTFFAFFGPDRQVTGCETSVGFKIEQSCIDALNTAGGKRAVGDIFKKAIDNKNLNYIWGSEIQGTTTTLINTEYETNKTYAFRYSFFLSTIVGLAMCWILLGFCLDLAIRVVKLGVLQIVAPIPILLSIAPGKKSSELLQKWGKECISTWTLLFVRIAVITFAIYLIYTINVNNGVMSFTSGETNQNVFVTVFVMFGILLFAKEFPKLIEDMLGIKGAKLTLNPFKKLSTDMLGAGLIGGATAGLLGGGLGGMARGAIKGAGAKNFMEGTTKAATANKAFREAKESGSTFGGRMGARYSKFTGARTPLEKIEREEKNIEKSMEPTKRKISNQEKIIKNIESQEAAAEKAIITNKGASYSEQYNSRTAEIKSLEASLNAATNDTDRNRISSEIVAKDSSLKKDLATWKREFIDKVNNGVPEHTNDEISALTSELGSMTRAYGIDVRNTAKDRHEDAEMLKNRNIELHGTIADKELAQEDIKKSNAREKAKADQDAVK